MRKKRRKRSSIRSKRLGRSRMKRGWKLRKKGGSRYALKKRRVGRRSRLRRSRAAFASSSPEVQFGEFIVEPHKRVPTVCAAGPLQRGVSILILTWNGLDYTKRCLESIRADVESNPLIEVIVFDNGSTDGTVEYLQSLTWIKPVYSQENLGFALGNNRAMDYTQPGNDLLLLNNDIICEQQHWVARLQETAYSDPAIGIVGCRLTDHEGRLYHAGTCIMTDDCMGQQVGAPELDINQYDRMQDVQGIVFACAYIKREVVERIGRLETAYISYFEDTDYCLRAWEAGYRVVYDPGVTLIHFHNTSTKVNHVDFWEGYNRAQQIFKQKWQERLRSHYELSVTWRSIANLPLYGYAESGKRLMNALDDQRVYVKYRYAYGSGTWYPHDEPLDGDNYRVNVFKKRADDQGHIEVVYGHGHVLHRNEGRYKIGYTMIESNRISKKWVKSFNQMNELWVPTHYNLYTLAKSGVKAPIHVMPLGFDPDYFHPGIRGQRLSPRYTFLSIFDWNKRKAPELLLRSFARTFAQHDDVLLVCKINNFQAGLDIAAEIRKLRLGPGAKNILVITNHLPHYMMGSLYRSADCYVSTSHAEGWGMCMMEAMACGLPVIAPNWGGHTEFFNDKVGYPIRIKRLIPVARKKKARWAQLDARHLLRLLRFVYENKEAAAAMGIQASQHVRSQWTCQHAAAKIKARLSQIHG